MMIIVLWIFADNIYSEHIYGITFLLIDNVPYHFEKYIPTEEEIRKFKATNDGDIQYSQGNFLYRLVPFTR